MTQIISQTIVLRVGDDIMSELTKILKQKNKDVTDLLILNAKFIRKTEFSIVMEVEYQL